MDIASHFGGSTSHITNCKHTRQGLYFPLHLVPKTFPWNFQSSGENFPLGLVLPHWGRACGAASLALECSSHPWTLRCYGMNIYLWALQKVRISRIGNTVWRVVSGMTLQTQAELQNKQLRRARNVANSQVLEGNPSVWFQACRETSCITYLLYTGGEIPQEKEFPTTVRKPGSLLQKIHGQWNSSQRAENPCHGWRFHSFCVPDVDGWFSLWQHPHLSLIQAVVPFSHTFSCQHFSLAKWTIDWNVMIFFYLSVINCDLFKVENNLYVHGTYMEIRKCLPPHHFLTVQNNLL